MPDGRRRRSPVADVQSCSLNLELVPWADRVMPGLGYKGGTLGGAPDLDVPVPEAVRSIAQSRPLLVRLGNESGGLTFELGGGTEHVQFIKWSPAASGIDLSAEARRLDWAVPFTPVPRVTDAGGNASGSWIVTAALRGESAVAERWLAEPAAAVAAIGFGLRSLHDALPIQACPFSWSAAARLAVAQRRARSGQLTVASWHPEHQELTESEAIALVSESPAIDRLVVCHGDACAPNTLLTVDGRWSGHVDLGALGLADRWADLAIATWSTEWNYGPGWEDQLLAAYGVAPDADRTRYYRLLWDLT